MSILMSTTEVGTLQAVHFMTVHLATGFLATPGMHGEFKVDGMQPQDPTPLLN
jgi:hypothetical protein